MLACSFFIKSSSKLLVTGTGIKAGSSLILGWIRSLILELLALEWWKFHTFELEYLWSQLANHDQILDVASLGWGKGCIRFWGRLTLAHWAQVSDCCPLGYLFERILLKCIYSFTYSKEKLVKVKLVCWINSLIHFILEQNSVSSLPELEVRNLMPCLRWTYFKTNLYKSPIILSNPIRTENWNWIFF